MTEERNLPSFLTYTHSSLLAELADVLQELTSLHRQLGDILTQESQAKINAWALSNEQSVSGREWEARQQSHTYTAEAFRIKAEIAAEIEARDFLRMLLNAP